MQPFKTKRFFALVAALAVLFFMTGCAGTPRRHLASDASLIQRGITTRQDMLNYFGEPDTRTRLQDGREKWVFRETRKSRLRQVPYVGRFVGSEEHEALIVILSGNVVTEASYRALDAGSQAAAPGTR